MAYSVAVTLLVIGVLAALLAGLEVVTKRQQKPGGPAQGANPGTPTSSAEQRPTESGIGSVPRPCLCLGKARRTYFAGGRRAVDDEWSRSTDTDIEERHRHAQHGRGGSSPARWPSYSSSRFCAWPVCRAFGG